MFSRSSVFFLVFKEDVMKLSTLSWSALMVHMVLHLCPPHMTAQILFVFEDVFFNDFFFQKLRYEKLTLWCGGPRVHYGVATLPSK